MVSHTDMPMPEGYAQGFSDIEDGKLKTKPDAPAWAVKEAKQFNKTLSATNKGVTLNRKAIKQFAIAQGYEDIRKSRKKYKNYEVYEPLWSDSNECIVGLPLVILVQGENIRMSTADEALEIGY